MTRYSFILNIWISWGNELNSVSETAANDISELRRAIEVLTESNRNLVNLVNGLVHQAEEDIAKWKMK